MCDKVAPFLEMFIAIPEDLYLLYSTLCERIPLGHVLTGRDGSEYPQFARVGWAILRDMKFNCHSLHPAIPLFPFRFSLNGGSARTRTALLRHSFVASFSTYFWPTNEWTREAVLHCQDRRYRSALRYCFRLADSSGWHQTILEPRDSNLYGTLEITLEMDGNVHDWGA